MAIKKMYKGVPYSPPTTLVTAINTTDTSIELLDGSVFPVDSNVAVIGIDELAETIIYSSRTGNFLTGVQRGVEGTAKSWAIGDTIGRNWANLDYQTIIDNVTTLDTNNDIHETSEKPHIALDTTAKKYKYGFKIDTDGTLVFVYEGV